MDYSKLSDATLKALHNGEPIDYSALSDEELKALHSGPSTPKAEPVKETEPEIEPISKTESGLRGAAQGATFGFADELTGGGESFMDLLGGDTSMVDNYKKHRDESRSNYKQAEEENPLTYLAGNLAGGLAVPVPGAGSATGVAALAKQGAIAGGLFGLGTSEADLTDPTDLGKVKDAGVDTLEGAGIGGVMGAGMGAIGKGLSKTKDFWTGSKYGKDLTDMFSYAKADPNFNTPQNLTQTTEGLFNTIKNEYIPMMTTDLGKAVSERYDAAYKEAAAQGKSLNFKEFRDQVTKALDNVKVRDKNYDRGRAEIEEYLNAVGQVSNKETSVVNDLDGINNATQKLQDKLGKGKVESDATIRNLASKYAQDIVDSDPSRNKLELEEEIFNKIKSTYDKGYNPKIGQEIDPITGQKYVKSEVVTPTGKTQIKAEQIKPGVTTGTEEVIGRPELDPDTLKEVAKKGQDIFDLFNMGNDSTRKNAVLADTGLTMKGLAKENAMDPVVQSELNGLRSSLGDIKAQIGIDHGGIQGDDLKKAQITAAEKIKDMFLRMAKDPDTNQGRRIETAKGIALELANKGIVDADKIEQVTAKLMDLSKKEYLMKSAQSESFLATDVKNHILLPFNARGKSLYLASGAGKASAVFDKTRLPEMGRALYDMVPDQLNKLAMKLESKNSKFAPVIRNIIDQPAAKRKAVMFTLMQQPAFRQLLESDDEAQ